MQRQIDYYFSLLSPWTYLGHELFLSIAARHGCTINYLPVPLRSVLNSAKHAANSVNATPSQSARLARM